MLIILIIYFSRYKNIFKIKPIYLLEISIFFLRCKDRNRFWISQKTGFLNDQQILITLKQQILMQTLADLEKYYSTEVMKEIMAQIEQDKLDMSTMYKDNTEYLKSKFETPISPRVLKEQRLRELLREFEEILDMDDDEWEAYENE